MRRRLFACIVIAPLLAAVLACGLTGEPCDVARGRRERALASYRGELEAAISRWYQRYDEQSRAEAQGSAAVSRSVLERNERDLAAVRRAEEALASGDEAAAARAIDAIPSPLGSGGDAYRELTDANLAVRTCTP